MNNYNSELYHYGVPGMRWGKRKAKYYQDKANEARESAKEWKEMGKYRAQKLVSKGKNEKAKKVRSKYNERARDDISDAREYDKKLKVEQTKNKFRQARGDLYKTRSTGAKLATNILGGAFANRTYNSVIAAGGTKAGARIATALASVGGPLGHIAVSAVFTNAAAKNDTIKRYDR